MGSMITRKNGRRVIQWIDGSGRQRQEALRATGVDGRPLSKRAAEQEARRRLAELESKARRQRHGLEPLPSESEGLSFGALLDWWWDQHGKTLRSPTVRPFLERHVRPALGDLPLREVTTARLRRLLADKSSELGPKSLNELRAFIHNIFEVAREQGGPWEGRVNPAAAVERLKVAPTPKKVLAPGEWEPVLGELPARLRGPVAVGLYAGLREGEIFGLRKEDVDRAAGVLMVSRSWDAPRTKDGKAWPVPIAPELWPRIEEALRSKGPLLFPRPDGSMYPRDLRLGDPLRAAIARAGLVEGYEHRCRAWRCGWRERQPDANVASAATPMCGSPSTPTATSTSRPCGRASRPRLRGRNLHRPCRSGLRLDCARAKTNFPGAEFKGCELRDAQKKAPRLLRNRGAMSWSGRQDSNLRPLGPEPSALPD